MHEFGRDKYRDTSIYDQYLYVLCVNCTHDDKEVEPRCCIISQHNSSVLHYQIINMSSMKVTLSYRHRFA